MRLPLPHSADGALRKRRSASLVHNDVVATGFECSDCLVDCRRPRWGRAGDDSESNAGSCDGGTDKTNGNIVFHTFHGMSETSPLMNAHIGHKHMQTIWIPASGNRHTTVDDDRLSGDEAARFGRQPHQSRSQFDRITHAAQQYSRFEALDIAGRIRVCHL